MNHPYLYPEDAPWTEEYHDYIETRTKLNSFDDEDELPQGIKSLGPFSLDGAGKFVTTSQGRT